MVLLRIGYYSAVQCVCDMISSFLIVYMMGGDSNCLGIQSTCEVSSLSTDQCCDVITIFSFLQGMFGISNLSAAQM